MRDNRLIAIHPNTIGFGYVVINEKGEILDFGIVPIRPVNNEKCLKRIREIVSYYIPNILVIQDPDNSKKSVRVKTLIRKICLNESRFLKILKYSRKQVKDTFSIFGAKNKFEISRKISEVYPELKSKLSEKRKPWEPENYYQGIFDSISLVLTHQYSIDKY